MKKLQIEFSNKFLVREINLLTYTFSALFARPSWSRFCLNIMVCHFNYISAPSFSFETVQHL